MTQQAASSSPRPLAGLRVLEVGGGAAAASCGRMLVDAGAQVTRGAWRAEEALSGLVREDLAWDEDYARFVHAGKHTTDAVGTALAQASRDFDLVIVGEGSSALAGLHDSVGTDQGFSPRTAVIELSWFGRRGGPWAHWQGSDLVVQALSGMPHMVGHAEGPPTFTGDRQATIIGGATAYIAACAASLQALTRPGLRHFEISILEANMVLSEMHMHFFERDGIPMQRCGLNRFSPNSPVGVYPCKDGWVGITITTPDQWRALCKALPLPEQAADAGLVTRELRFARQDEVEAALVRVLATRTADEWGAIGRAHRVPIVVVPNAAGILEHPVFRERGSLATLKLDERTLQVPRTPLALQASPMADRLESPEAQAAPPSIAQAQTPPTRAASIPAAPRHTAFNPASTAKAAQTRPALTPAPADAGPLQGLKVVDFTMGWAGPLAARLLGDLGATVLKIEAARYPDWWRGVNWTPEYIRDKGYENAKTFCGLNRGKQGVSLDLTRDEGQALALELIRGADVVIENQASGVMAKLGLGEDVVRASNPRAVMVSMSAFGTGNAWSETRAYGSTLEQGAGVPCFTGQPQDPPTMAHLAYGDPIGGLFGCAAALTALFHRANRGSGQYANVSMVEAMLQFTAPSLLAYQRDPSCSLRWGNRHPVFAPHGIFAARGQDQWLAVSVQDDAAFLALARLLEQPQWLNDTTLRTASGRRERCASLERAIAAWAADRDADEAAGHLQQAGIAAAPLLKAQALPDLEHFAQTGFYIDLVREVSGPQRQLGLAIVQQGQRLGNRSPAPLLGEHSQTVLAAHASVNPEGFARLLQSGVVSYSPTPSRNLVAPTESTPS